MRLQGVPYRFSAVEHTYVNFATPDREIVLPVEPSVLEDLYLVVSCAKPADEGPHNVLEVEFYREGTVLHTTQLASITHLCDWFAPFGNHMWGGGG